MARNGDIPAGVAIRLGRQVRFDMDALERWLKSGGAALPGGWRREPEE
ncbi:MAG TPA: helix-turn-helix domain-containing protein [Thermoanaerobaculales bacterium]|nr:helix-turn-helix domain-containing protein [Thermoanaerobaculales bacterium]